jgi:hypothetical protein
MITPQSLEHSDTLNPYMSCYSDYKQGVMITPQRLAHCNGLNPDMGSL